MRTLARAAASSLAWLCVALALVAVAVAAIGIAGTRSAVSQGNAIADDGQADHRDASADAARVTGLITGAAALGIVIGLLVLWHGIRRIRRNLEPGQDQAEFAETLQIAGDEDEAHRLLQRHLERTLPATSATVLNRNNSADRLEAVTPLPTR